MNGKGVEFNRVGRWWDGSNVEIDIVAYNSMGKDILFGECKYSVNKKGLEVLRQLKQKAKAVLWNRDDRKEKYVIFSRSGFTDELLEYAAGDEDVILEQIKADNYKAEAAVKAMREMSKIAEANGVADMTLDEINAEIYVARCYSMGDVDNLRK